MSTSEIPTPPPERIEVPYYVKALAMALPAILLGIQLSGWVFFIAPIRDGHPDFRANYTAGVMITTGEIHQLYDYDAVKRLQDKIISQEVVGMPFIHPAYEALAYIPFSLLRFRTAYCVFLVLNLVLIFVCYRALRRELRPAALAWKFLPITLCFTFLPVGAALMQGQDSILMLACFVWSWMLMECERDFGAGLALGLSVFRFQFLAPICLLFLLWKRWRVVSGIFTSAAACLLVSLVMVGTEGARTYARMLASMSVGGVTPLERLRYYQPVAAMGSLRALISDTLARWLPGAWIQTLIVLASLGVIAWVGRSARTSSKNSDLLLVAVTTSAIVGYHIFIHDLAILLLPLAVWVGRSIAVWRSNRRYVLVSATVMFFSPALMALRVVHFYWITLAIIFFLGTQLRLIGHHSQLCLRK